MNSLWISDANDNCPNHALISATDFSKFEIVKLYALSSTSSPNWIILNKVLTKEIFAFFSIANIFCCLFRALKSCKLLTLTLGSQLALTSWLGSILREHSTSDIQAMTTTSDSYSPTKFVLPFSSFGMCGSTYCTWCSPFLRTIPTFTWCLGSKDTKAQECQESK